MSILNTFKKMEASATMAGAGLIGKYLIYGDDENSNNGGDMEGEKKKQTSSCSR